MAAAHATSTATMAITRDDGRDQRVETVMRPHLQVWLAYPSLREKTNASASAIR